MRIELLDVGYTHAGHAIVKDVNFIAESASTTIIRGKTGSGKSTLANILCGLLTPSSGQCIIDGKPIVKSTSSDARSIRKRIGYIEQSPSFHEHLSAFDNVLIASAARGMDSVRATSEALERFADLGISHIRSHVVSGLSNSERIAVAAARALIGATSIIIADHSFDGQDEVSLRTFLDTLVRLSAGERTLIMTTTAANLDVILPNAAVYELRDGLLTNISKLPSEESQTQNGEPS